MISRRCPAIAAFLLCGLLAAARPAKAGKLFSADRAQQAAKLETTLSFEGRDIYVHAPKNLPPAGTRALVVVLHGGMGNAARIVTQNREAGLNLDAMADKYGFVVAYLNGSPVTRFLGKDKKGWNAGMCCGQSSRGKTDDLGYIISAVGFLSKEYGIDESKIYGLGHSNGAMMTQRVMCEAGIYAAAVSVSGTLELKTDACPAAKGRRLLSIIGSDDTAVPVGGGNGQGIDSRDYKNSQAYSKDIFTRSGASYTIDVVKGAQHKPETIDAALQKTQGVTLQQKIIGFLGLDK
ncbi:MAG: hypothetical protein GC185_05430 [Alphaproteobacteria bacterium]|nr:hypothetical protein [Alphaproteobacteria bacterium]